MLDSYVIPPLLDEIMAGEKEIEQKIPYLEILTGYCLQFDPNDNGWYRSSQTNSIMIMFRTQASVYTNKLGYLSTFTPSM